ncbi:MAG: malonyl-CoA decarboxylase [Qingshengfaniella sp.]
MTETEDHAGTGMDTGNDRNAETDRDTGVVRARPTVGLASFVHNVADAGLQLLRVRRDAAGITAADIEAECEELMSTRGEASGTAIARRVMDLYQRMNAREQLTFFRILRTRFHLDAEAVYGAARILRDTGDDAALARFLKLAEPRRQELFRRLNMAPDGTRSLVDMRRALLTHLPDNPDLRPVDSDLRHVLASWFNRGFLHLRSIDWGTPAAVLEKLIAYETVHEMQGWDDLRRRLASDRRCFAFFHTALPEDPLVFVEVALVKGVSRDIAPIIGLDRQELPVARADTAIFYSINNCLDGLRGISFGNFLIKQVVVELRRELPNLRTFATLSPVPGFRRWLTAQVLGDPDSPWISAADRQTLAALDRVDWHLLPDVADTLKPILTRLIAAYLVRVKSGDHPTDPVARFHLGNGARLDSLNWLGDISEDRMAQSCGFLVNYVYDLKAIEENHEVYVKNHQVVTSRKIAELAAAAGPAKQGKAA